MGAAMPVPEQRLDGLRELLAADRRRVWTAPSATAASMCCTSTSPARRWCPGMAVMMATSPVVGTFHAALDASGYYDQEVGRGHAHAAHRRARGSQRGGEGVPCRAASPGPTASSPTGCRWRSTRRRSGRPKCTAGSCSSGAPSAARDSACCFRRSRSCASARLTRRWSSPAPRVGRCSRPTATARGLPVDLAGVEALGLGRRRGEDRPAGGGGDRCAPSSRCRELRHRAGGGDGRRRAGGRLGPAGLPCRAARRPSRPADAARRPRRAGRCALRPPAGRRGRRRLAAAGSAAAAELSWGRITDSVDTRPTRTRSRRRECAACTACPAGRGSAARCSTTPPGRPRAATRARRAREPRRRRLRLTSAAARTAGRRPFCRAEGRVLDSAFAARGWSLVTGRQRPFAGA